MNRNGYLLSKEEYEDFKNHNKVMNHMRDRLLKNSKYLSEMMTYAAKEQDKNIKTIQTLRDELERIKKELKLLKQPNK